MHTCVIAHSRDDNDACVCGVSRHCERLHALNGQND